MPHVRSRKLRTGSFWYFVEGNHETPCGPGQAGRDLAHRKLSSALTNARLRRLGFEAEQESVWTVAELRAADLEEARRRGLLTAAPQFQGKLSKRESHWNTLVEFFTLSAPLDDITGDRIRAFITWREGSVSATTINRDLAILKTALAHARDVDASGYGGDPFRKVRRLRERHQKPISLDEKALWGVVAACWERHKPLGAYVELLVLTASRLHQEPALDGASVSYAPQKRGNPRAFQATRRLRHLLSQPRHFSRRIWLEAVTAVGQPSLTPHHLRHSALTLAGSRPDASPIGLMALGGWKSLDMVSAYLHPGSSLISPLAKAGTPRKPKR